MVQLSTAGNAWAAIGKGIVVAASGYTGVKATENIRSLRQRHVVQHHDKRQVRQRKKADCFSLLKRITRLKKCKFRDQIEDSLSYLERYSPKGSWHDDESSMNHTLAQNNLCEFWCGMHLTCKNTPIIPDRSGSGEKTRESIQSFYRHSLC